MSCRHLTLLLSTLVISLSGACLEPPLEPSGPDAVGALESGPPVALDPAPAGVSFSTVTGPSIAWGSTDTVWEVTRMWNQVSPEAGIAWPADSGLTWEEKYVAWVESMATITREDGGTTFEISSPHGVLLPAPVLESTEVAILLRVAFASWYGLPFHLEASVSGSRVYLGHFGFRNADGTRFSATPNFRTAYVDHTETWAEGMPWPSDANLAARGVFGGGDEMPFLPDVNGEPARAGAYFDALFLNKRAGHFMLLAIAWFGSTHLASEANMMHVQPEAIRAGDVLLHRWQPLEDGHTMPVMRVSWPLVDRLHVALASGPMPRRQPLWEEGASVVSYFTSDHAGGPGVNDDGDAYATLGGGLRRWRVPTPMSGIWVAATGSSAGVAIDASSHAEIAARPARFAELFLLDKGESCSADAECRSNRCRGRAGAQVCR
jgi:hypothetical protein